MKKIFTLALVATMLAAGAPEAKAQVGCCDQGYEIKSHCGTCDQGYLTTGRMAVALGASALLLGIALYRNNNHQAHA